MREYIYLWVHEYVLLGKDDSEKNRYLFENIGIPLSSKYEINDNFDEESKKLTVNVKKCCESDNINYFSEHISDLVAIVGDNGSGKSSILRLLKSILTNGEGDIADDIGYLLLYVDKQDDKQIMRGKYTLREKGIEFEVSPNLNENKIDIGTIYKKEPHKSDYLVFYSPFFNVSKGLFHGDYHGSRDISTENIIGSHSEKLHNPRAGKERFFDRLESYSSYEQQIELDFVADFLKNEGELPMDLPTYMRIKNNSYVIALLKNELHENEDERWFGIIEKMEERINSLKDRIYLSAFVSLYRSYNSSSFNPFADRFDNITEETNIEDALNAVEFGIVSELEKMITLIEENLKRLSFDDYWYLLFIRQRKEELKQIMNLHYNISKKHHLLTPFLLFERQRLSTGEDNFIQFFARFYHIWKDIPSEDLLNAKDIVFLIDEGEANFHPEWQRKYLKMLIDWIELIMKKLKNDEVIERIPKFQVILSTHSPFVACDLPKNNMVRLKLKEKNNKDDFKSVGVLDALEQKNTGIGASIIDLLKNDFFIKSTVGALAVDKITKMVEEIREYSYEKMSTESKYVFDNLGMQFIKKFLKEGNANDENTNNKQ